MAILLSPIMKALSPNDKGSQLYVNVETQGCCGSIICCSRDVEQTTYNRRVVYMPPTQGEGGQGGLVAEKNGFLSRLFKSLCCCCVSKPANEAEDNIVARTHFFKYLEEQYGRVVAHNAVREVFGEMEWHASTNALTIKHVFILKNKAKEIRNEIENSEVYKQHLINSGSTQTASPPHLPMRSLNLPAPHGGVEEENKEDDSGSKKSSSADIQALPKTSPITRAGSGPHHVPVPGGELSISHSLTRALQVRPQHLSANEAVELYQVLKNPIAAKPIISV